MPRLRRKISDLDPIDKRIIEILQVNAKTPYREMAKKLGLSISTVHERVKKLERKGIIQGYVALINPLFRHEGMEAYICLKVSDEHRVEVVDGISKLDEIVEIIETEGKYDLVLRAVIENRHKLNYLLNRLKGVKGVKEVYGITSLRRYLREIYEVAGEDNYRILKGFNSPVRPTLGGLIPLALLRNIILTVHTLDPNAKKLFYQAGFEWGSSTGYKRYEGTNLKKLLEEYCEIVKDLRLAVGEIVSVSDNEAIVRLHECAVCYGAPNVGTSICSFQAGNLAGILSKKLEKRVTVVEMKCRALGHDFCEFHIYVS